MTDSPDTRPDPQGPAEAFESQLDSMQVKLQSFEGPLDLLVHLIRKNQVDVYDIPIALITKQYLDYLDLMQELNLDLASEFLVMAATLIHIKSRTLLPRPDPAQDDQAEEDPRDALVRRLLEHQKYKAAAELLHERETLRSAQWPRPDSRVEAIAGDEYEPELEVDLFGLLAAFNRVLERARDRPPMALPPEQVSIETRIEQLLARLSEAEACGFEDLFDHVAGRSDMIVTFLALLEMIRLRLIRIFQSGPKGPIRIYRRARPQDAPHPIHDPEDEYRTHQALSAPASTATPTSDNMTCDEQGPGEPVADDTAGDGTLLPGTGQADAEPMDRSDGDGGDRERRADWPTDEPDQGSDERDDEGRTHEH